MRTLLLWSRSTWKGIMCVGAHLTMRKFIIKRDAKGNTKLIENPLHDQALHKGCKGNERKLFDTLDVRKARFKSTSGRGKIQIKVRLWWSVPLMTWCALRCKLVAVFNCRCIEKCWIRKRVLLLMQMSHTQSSVSFLVNSFVELNYSHTEHSPSQERKKESQRLSAFSFFSQTQTDVVCLKELYFCIQFLLSLKRTAQRDKFLVDRHLMNQAQIHNFHISYLVIKEHGHEGKGENGWDSKVQIRKAAKHLTRKKIVFIYPFSSRYGIPPENLICAKLSPLGLSIFKEGASENNFRWEGKCFFPLFTLTAQKFTFRQIMAKLRSQGCHKLVRLGIVRFLLAI